MTPAPSPSEPLPGTLPEPHATTLRELRAALTRFDLPALEVAARAMDWEELCRQNQAAEQARANAVAVKVPDQLLDWVASCFAKFSSDRPRTDQVLFSQRPADLKVFAGQALERLVASGYRALDAPSLETLLRQQTDQAPFTQVLATVCFRHGCVDAQGGTALHHAFQVRGSSPEHLSAALVPAVAAGQVNAQTHAGDTAWHRWCTLPGLVLLNAPLAPRAARNLESLLAAGLDPDIRNHAGKTGEECLEERIARGESLSPEVIAGWKALLAAHRAQTLDKALPAAAPTAARPAPRL